VSGTIAQRLQHRFASSWAAGCRRCDALERIRGRALRAHGLYL
jgi:hypothetical protein